MYKRVLIFAGEGWHPGIIGIVAAKICEKYAKPCILIAIEGEEARGSGRSYPAFSLIDAITACSQHLTRFGGHVQAAGLSIPTRDIDAFIAQMDEYTRTHFAQMPPMSLNIDLEVLPRQLSLAGVKTLAMLEPFGQGNPSPVFCIRGAVIQEITPLSEDKHLRLKLFCDHQMFTAMYFHMSSRAFLFARGDTVDLAVEAGINVYNQTESVSLKVLDMRRSNTDYGALYTCVSLIDRLCLKEPLGAAQCEYLIPVREETGRVYKALLAMKGADMPLMRFYSAILRESVPYGKMVTSLYILREMHLIEGSITRENIRLCPCKVEK